MRGRCTTGTGGPRAKHQQTRGVSLSSPLPPLPFPRSLRRIVVMCTMPCACAKQRSQQIRVAIPLLPLIPNQGRSDPMRSLATTCQGRAAGSLTPLTVEEAQIPSPTHRHTPQLLYLGKGFIAGRAQGTKQQRRDTKACDNPTRKTGASAARRKEKDSHSMTRRNKPLKGQHG